MTAKLHLQAMDVWHEHQHDPAWATLHDIDARQRRRLSRLAQLSLSIRQQLAASGQLQAVDYILWCSEYGDEHKTLAILNDIASGETPSPTAFSTSVHNATAGLYSMLYQDDTPSSSLNVGIHDFTSALLYAYALLQQNAASAVLIVCADEPLPAAYQHCELSHAFALACVVRLASAEGKANLRIVPALNAETVTDAPLQRPEALQFAQFWQQQHTSIQLGAWQLCRL